MKKILLTIVLAAAASVAVCAKDIYVSPQGSDDNAGTLEAPYLTLKKAIENASAGTTIYLREGTYKPQTGEIMRSKAEGAYDCIYNLDKKGTATKPIEITSYEGEKVTFDLSDVKTENRIIGFYVKADYWRLRGFDIVGIQVTQTGHTQSINVGLFGGNNCIIEQVNMHDGMGIGVYATRGNDNLVLNCDAYNNYDPVSENGAGGNCDGFGFHFNKATYTGNVIRGCRAWRNSDDGYDLINNYAPVTIENCWAWENGYDADRVSRGDGSGFKSGGFGMSKVLSDDLVAPRNVVKNCIAWSNKQNGIYANHHLGGIDFINNTAYRNKRNYNMVNRKSPAEMVDVDGYEHHLMNNLAFKPTLSDANIVNVNQELCIISNNTFLPTVSVSDADFESLDDSQLLLPRKADGSLPDITFLKLRTGTPAYAKGMGWQFGQEESGIENVEAAPAVDDSYYNLQGVKVSNPSAGVYIHRGKKVLVR